MAASGRALIDTLQELHRERLSFAQAQFSESIEVGRQFARCRSPKDLLELQMRDNPFVGAGGERQSKAAAGARALQNVPVLRVPAPRDGRRARMRVASQ
jgi:hypothetical protein